MESVPKAQIKVVGVGGGGVNALRRMAGAKIPGVELLCVNTDRSSLGLVEGLTIIPIGERATRGLGAGGDPRVGALAAEESRDELREHLVGADLVFITAGMGGGTGTGAAPVVASLAKEAGAITVAVVTTPFSFEGARRMSVASAGMRPLRDLTDTMIMVSNERLMSLVGRRTPVRDAFTMADQVMVQAILGVAHVVNVPGEVNVDFADLKVVVANGGSGIMAIGRGEGEHRVLKAARAALAHPLLDVTAQGAKSVLFTVMAGPDLTLDEVSEAGAFIATTVDPEAQIFFGMHTEPARDGGREAELVLIATHLPGKEALEQQGKEAAAPFGRDYEDLPGFLQGNGRQSGDSVPGEPASGQRRWWSLGASN